MLIDVDEHPPLPIFALMQRGVGGAPSLQQNAPQAPASRKIIGPIKLDTTILPALGQHEDLTLPAKDEGIGEMIGPLQNAGWGGKPSLRADQRMGDVGLAAALIEVLEEQVG